MNKVLGFAVGLLATVATTTAVLFLIRYIRPAANIAGLSPADKAVGPDAFRDVA